MRLLQEDLSFLLDLPLRFHDLPELHGREPLGHVVQQHDLDLPRLRRGEDVLSGEAAGEKVVYMLR